MLSEAKNAVKARFCELACIERWLTLPTFKMLANMMEMIEYGKTVVVYLVFLFFVSDIRHVIWKCVLF